jgi:hypothetical protein
MSFFSHNYVKNLTEPCHNDIILLVDAVSDYLYGVEQYMLNHNFFPRMKCLIATQGTDHALAEALDKDLTRACLSASKKCRNLRQTPWSPKVIKARDLVNILKRLLGIYRTGSSVCCTALQ